VADRHGTSREEGTFTMETTMAATPKAARARMAAESPLAFPVPPPPSNTARMMPAFAFPPANDPSGPTRAREMGPTRRTTARVPRPSSGSLSDGLAGLASLVENVPLPVLPESAWTIIGRAWFFIAGTTMGIMLALALIALSGPKHGGAMAAREGRVVTAQGTARVLVIQHAPTAAERGIGALAENDLDEVAPASASTPAAPPVVRRTAAVARRPAAGNRAPGKDILSAGL
jgi:hypothetical protein